MNLICIYMTRCYYPRYYPYDLQFYTNHSGFAMVYPSIRIGKFGFVDSVINLCNILGLPYHDICKYCETYGRGIDDYHRMCFYTHSDALDAVKYIYKLMAEKSIK